MNLAKDRDTAKEIIIDLNQDTLSYTCINCGAALSGPGECKFCDTSYSSFSIDSSLITYQCTNCGASVVSSKRGPGVCRFCGTDYRAPDFDSKQSYVRITPKFPERGLPGSIRDNELEIKIENDFLKKLKDFYGKGDEARVKFLQIFVQAVHRSKRHPVSIYNRLDPKQNIMSFFENEGYAKTENQSNLLRALPEIISDEYFWGDFSTVAFTQGMEELIDLRTQLEFSFGFLIPYEDSDSSNDQNQNKDNLIVEERKPSSNSSVMDRIKNMFRFGRNRS